MSKVRTLQLGNKLIILNGKDPLRYVDLSTNKVHQYEPLTRGFKFTYSVRKSDV